MPTFSPSRKVSQTNYPETRKGPRNSSAKPQKGFDSREVVSLWRKTWSYDETIRFLKVLSLKHAAQGGEQGERIAACISGDNLPAVCNFDLKYDVGTTEELRHCRSALGLITKLEPLRLGVDKELAAYQTWLWAEDQCKQTNDMFRSMYDGSFFLDTSASSVFHKAQRKIAHVLGKCPTFAELNYRFGPGATTLTKKRLASSYNKLKDGISCSEDLLPYAHRILEEMPLLSSLHSREESEDHYSVGLTLERERVHFVPKSAKTYRSISVNPTLNVMVQLALGDTISDRLASIGIDLKDQTLNQRLAKVGSIDGSLATIDLTSASDTISHQLVAHLLPFEWLIALSSCRSSSVEVRDNVIQLEKFSSQGNGYTFPLQSLIFWAISSSVCDEGDTVSVYGDDLIVPSDHFSEVVRVLRIAGFTPNVAKSYSTGLFRESCGADYLSGINIRPYYQKNLVSLAELYKLHNWYVRAMLLDFADLVRERIDPRHRIYGPDGYGDGHLVGPYVPIRLRKHLDRGFAGHCFMSVKESVKDHLAKDPDTLLVASVYEIYNKGHKPEFIDYDASTVKHLLIYNNWLRYVSVSSLPIPELGTVKRFTVPGAGKAELKQIYTF